jgi:hypothetical protein
MYIQQPVFSDMQAETNTLREKKVNQKHACLKGAFHRSLTVLVRYRFPLHIRYKTKHQYLAFDVSLPPPNNLSCSPKQLDSGSKNVQR